MTRTVSALLLVALSLGLAVPAWATVVLVTAAAPLDDESDEGVQAALDEAVGQAVQDAVRMGFRPVRLTDAQVWGDQVVVEILATDVQPDDGDEAPGIRPAEFLTQTF